MFVPVDVALGSDAVAAAAKVVDSMRGLPDAEWKAALADPEGLNLRTREENKRQGAGMRTYMSETGVYAMGGERIKEAVEEAERWMKEIEKM
mmetsp:Transcript_17294/g.34703  ORF Transcript_17294/g.34703 Transcript_17294/m.34703 type:complete len:92 (-) Transcript_17294:30-305(-)